MSETAWKVLTGGAEELALAGGYSLRLLSARETLEADREAEALAQGGRERALCANACLLARALLREGETVFSDGNGVLSALTARQIAALSRRWAAFDRQENPSAGDGEQVDALKKVWSTHRRTGSAGAC